MSSQENAENVLAYLSAVEACDKAKVGSLLSPDIVQIELPNALKPQGGRRGFDEMLAGLDMARKLMMSQSYDVTEIYAVDDAVAVEAKWIGKLAVPLGRLQPGDEMVCYSAMFFDLKDGLIVRQRNYDSFEPFA